MSTYGMNPFMNNSTYSTWLIVLMILNLPPWLFNKQKYIMLPGLIPMPQQPENDIDTYLRPLVEDLKLLWNNNRVEVWDEHKREYFQLKAIVFMTISDSPAACNLLGQSKKLGCGCPHYFSETNSVFERVMKNNLHGTLTLHGTEKMRPLPYLTGLEVYEMVKGVHIVLGKRKRTVKNIEEDDM
jgi:hypothetical protein